MHASYYKVYEEQKLFLSHAISINHLALLEFPWPTTRSKIMRAKVARCPFPVLDVERPTPDMGEDRLTNYVDILLVRFTSSTPILQRDSWGMRRVWRC